jgi:hypothetical protein
VPGGRAEIAGFVGLHRDNSKVDGALLNRDGDVRFVGDRTGKPFKGSDLAPRSSGKEDSLKLETFRWNPAGNQSRPVELDQQPEASLAWWVGNCPCEA